MIDAIFAAVAIGLALCLAYDLGKMRGKTIILRDWTKEAASQLERSEARLEKARMRARAAAASLKEALGDGK